MGISDPVPKLLTSRARASIVLIRRLLMGSWVTSEWKLVARGPRAPGLFEYSWNLQLQSPAWGMKEDLKVESDASVQ